MSRLDDDDLMHDDEFADVRAALGLAVPPVPAPAWPVNLAERFSCDPDRLRTWKGS